MQQKTDTRLTRAKAKSRRDRTAARHRSLLRARVALSALLHQRSAPVDGDPALARALHCGAAAAAKLTRLSDTPELRETDAALLAGDHAGAEERFETRLLGLVRHRHDCPELAPDNASPAELLAAYVANAAIPHPSLPRLRGREGWGPARRRPRPLRPSRSRR
jgi:hypothetical protein